MFEVVCEEYCFFGVYIVVGKVCFVELCEQVEGLCGNVGNDLGCVQELVDFDVMVVNLDKCIGDLIVL